MEEIVLNLHIHSTYSDGSGNFHEIAQAALSAELDAVIVTDHNLLLKGKDALYYRNGKRMLLLVGEEVHDMQGSPGNHLLILNYPKEIAHLASNMQLLINEANHQNAITILAHPYESEIKAFNVRAFGWDQWEVKGFTGIEIFNQMSEFKNRSRNLFALLLNALFPKRFLTEANPKALAKWDELLNAGHRVFAYTGSDAHQSRFKFGPIKLTLFPYLTHFSALNTHAYLPQPLTGELEQDRSLIYIALKKGKFHIGLDWVYPTKGFEFKADYEGGSAYSGDQLIMNQSATIKINLPVQAIVHLLRNGEVIGKWDRRVSIAHTITTAGVYRVECYFPVQGSLAGWIYSNPIFVYKGKNDGQ